MRCKIALVALSTFVFLTVRANAQSCNQVTPPALCIDPISWNVIGLDSNAALPPKNDGPDTFMVGSREFDPGRVGFRSSGYDGFRFDTHLPGNANTGHLYGTALPEADKRALLEFLKTL